MAGFETDTTKPVVEGIFTGTETEREKYPGSGDESGPALLLGVGYGIPVGSGGTRILTTLSYSLRPGPQGIFQDTGESYPKGGVRVVGLTVGGMF